MRRWRVLSRRNQETLCLWCVDIRVWSVGCQRLTRLPSIDDLQSSLSASPPSVLSRSSTLVLLSTKPPSRRTRRRKLKHLAKMLPRPTSHRSKSPSPPRSTCSTFASSPQTRSTSWFERPVSSSRPRRSARERQSFICNVAVVVV